MREKQQDFTQGAILPALLKFALPVLLALLLQAMYGAVDLQVVGRFGTAADISAVSTGSQIMQSITIIITGLAMGVTVLLGQKIGEGRPEEAGAAVGSGICLFGVLTLATIKSIVVTSGLRDPWWQSITTGAMLCFFILLQSVVLSNRGKLKKN